MLSLVRMMNVNDLMLIGELAAALDVSCDTLRHYERKGVIRSPKRAANGYRLYSAETLQRLRTVRRALAVGFTLDELADIFRERDEGGAPCRTARALAGQKLADLDERLREIMALRKELRAIVQDWDARLADTDDGGKADLLASIPNVQITANHKTSTSFASKSRKRGKNNGKS